MLASSKEEFGDAAHREIALTCLRGLLAKNFESDNPAQNAEDSNRMLSVELSFKSWLRPWKVPESGFLRNYIQDYVFDHFDLARSHFSDSEPDSTSLLISSCTRREGLYNFLNLSCLAVFRSLLFGFDKNIRGVSCDLSAFGMSNVDLTSLMCYFNNVVAASEFLLSRSITMFQEMTFEPIENRKIEFLISFCFIPSSPPNRQPIAPEAAFPASISSLPEAGEELYRVCALRIFAPLEVGRQLLEPKSFTYRFKKMSKLNQYGNLVAGNMTLTEWDIVPNICTLGEMFSQTERNWRNLPQTQLHMAGPGKLVGLLYSKFPNDLYPADVAETDRAPMFRYHDTGYESIRFLWR